MNFTCFCFVWLYVFWASFLVVGVLLCFIFGFVFVDCLVVEFSCNSCSLYFRRL
jgi:hypothetical protein